jgi:hypothetical protein
VLRWILQEYGEFTWRVSDCEELVGGYSQEIEGNVISGSKEKECDAMDKYMDA